MDVVEAWQEFGAEYATVRLNANLLDYTIDEHSGAVLSGSKMDPVKFEEHWTFVRPLSDGSRWKISAIENEKR